MSAAVIELRPRQVRLAPRGRFHAGQTVRALHPDGTVELAEVRCSLRHCALLAFIAGTLWVPADYVEEA